MVDCNQLTTLIKQGPKGEETAMKKMLLDKQYQRAAYVAHFKYEKIHAIADWEDIFYAAVVRFVHMVLRYAEQEKPMQYDCLGYFKTICRHVCSEYSKGERPLDPRLFDLFDVPADLAPKLTMSKAEKLMQYFSLLDKKCQKLLEARFLWNPEEKDREVLSELTDGEVAPESIPTTMLRCKNKLRGLIGDNLQDILTP